MDYIKIDDIIVTEYQRKTMPWTIQDIVESIKDHGYNEAYPIIIDDENNLVDGGHRREAAILCGLTEIPFIRKPDNGISNIRYALICNADRAKGREDDVFDLAELCWRMGKKAGLGYDTIAKTLGWSAKSVVANHSSIKERLHPASFHLARFSTKSTFENSAKNLLENGEFSIENRWRESHFRPIVRYIPLNGTIDPAIYRAQNSVISQCLYRWQKKPKDAKGRELKVTAKWIEEIAKKEAWHIKLKRYAIDNLKSWVGIRQRIALFQNITQGNFGNEQSEAGLDQLKNAVEALNGKVPQLYVGSAEDMKEIADSSIDIIITSPTYNLGESNWKMGGGGRTHRGKTVGYDQHDDNLPEQDYQDWQIECLVEMYRVAKPGASLFYNHKVRSQNSQAVFPHQWLLKDDNPWTIRQEILWHRSGTHNHNARFFWPEDERIFWMVKGDRPTLHNDSIGVSTVWRFPASPPHWHPAPFPEELPRRCLKTIGGKNLVVLDPFAGSCTALRVALSEFGFEAIGYDISEGYLKRAKEENGWKT